MTTEASPEEVMRQAPNEQTDEAVALTDEERALLDRLEEATTEEERLAIEALLLGEDTDAGLYGDDAEVSQESEAQDGNC